MDAIGLNTLESELREDLRVMTQSSWWRQCPPHWILFLPQSGSKSTIDETLLIICIRQKISWQAIV